MKLLLLLGVALCALLVNAVDLDFSEGSGEILDEFNDLVNPEGGVDISDKDLEFLTGEGSGETAEGSGDKDRDIVTVEGSGETSDKDFERSDIYDPHYCLQEDSECEDDDLLEIFGVSPRACTTRCNRDLECGSIMFKDKVCYLRSRRCTKSELVDNKGAVTLYRRKKGEECSQEVGPDFVSEIKYGRTFCRLTGYHCPQHGLEHGSLYRRPQTLKPWLVCLMKCARIRTCTGADFFDETGKACDLRYDMCADEELVESPLAINYIRLDEDEEECPGDREAYVVPTPCDEED